jgi:hypothetical protein
MAPNRLTPKSSTPGAVPGDSYMNDVAEEIQGLWDISVLFLSAVGGTGNAITATAAPVLLAGLSHGMGFYLVPTAGNTAAATLAINGGSAVAVVDKNNVALTSGALVVGRRYQLVYDGDISKYVVLSEVGNPASVPTTYVDIQQFTASGTWTKPARAVATSMTFIYGWGAGGGGRALSATGGGGGGGYKQRWRKTSDLGATETVTIPAGGAIATAGGNATFGAHLTAYGGGRGETTSGAFGGGGGGAFGVGANGTAAIGGSGGGPAGGAGAAGGTPGGGNSGWGGGGGGGNSAGGDSGYGGAGGTGGSTGGNSLYGGAGGSGGTGGTSLYGGNGGGNGVAGSAPGGGGGANAAGARGEIWAITYI